MCERECVEREGEGGGVRERETAAFPADCERGRQRGREGGKERGSEGEGGGDREKDKRGRDAGTEERARAPTCFSNAASYLGLAAD